MNTKGISLLLICHFLIPIAFADDKEKSESAPLKRVNISPTISRASVHEISKSQSSERPNFDSHAQVLNLKASLIPVTTKNPNGLSQADLKQQVSIALKSGAEDQLGFALSVSSGSSATARRINHFWYPADYEKGSVHLSPVDKGIYSLPKGEASPNETTYIIPASATKMAMTEIGYTLQIDPKLNPDGSIKLQGSLTNKTLSAFEKPMPDVTVVRKTIGGKDRTTTITPNRLEIPAFRTETKRFDVSKVANKYYIPFPIPVKESTDPHPWHSSEDQDVSSWRKTVSTGQRPGVLVLEVGRNNSSKTPEKGKVKSKVPTIEKQIYITSKFIESNAPWNSYSFEIAGKPSISPFNKTAPTGIFTDLQFQMAMRGLNQKKAVDLLSAPSLMAREGNRGKIEVTREFIFPAEYDAPRFNAKDGNSPASPSVPRKFEIKHTGITLEVIPYIVGSDRIKLNLKSTICEFGGFINYGNPLIELKPYTIQKNRAYIKNQNRTIAPVFPILETETDVIIPDGHTIAVSMIRTVKRISVEETGPLGLRKKKTEVATPRFVTLFLRAQIMDPSGRPVN